VSTNLRLQEIAIFSNGTEVTIGQRFFSKSVAATDIETVEYTLDTVTLGEYARVELKLDLTNSSNDIVDTMSQSSKIVVNGFPVYKSVTN